MNALELSQAIGHVAELTADGIRVLVHIMDAKHVYGCTRYLVTPVSGSDQVWVDAMRVKIQSEVKS
jgi:hypothetical protein